MESTRIRQRAVALPANTLQALRRALSEATDPLAAFRALQRAGHAVGTDLWEEFEGSVRGAPTEMGESAFFRALGDFFSARGWGSLRHSAPHVAVGMLTSPDWAEAGAEDGRAQPTCAFTSGALSAVLSRAAGHPVAVLQVSCRSRGDDECGFAFGSEATVARLYELLLEGRSFPAALGEL